MREFLWLYFWEISALVITGTFLFPGVLLAVAYIINFVVSIVKCVYDVFKIKHPAKTEEEIALAWVNRRIDR